MIFQQILLQIFHKLKGERTISAPFHMLRGKRSGQTVQDVGIFQLHNYFGILPKLSRKVYDEQLSELIENNLIVIQDDNYYILTQKALEQVKSLNLVHFNGWHYRGNEHLFFARLSLTIQSLSHQVAGVMSFLPIQKEPQIQQWVRSFLLANRYQKGHLQEILLQEIIASLEKIEVDDQAKSIVASRITGYKIAGYTWQQLSIYEERSEMDIQLIYIACLHNWLNEITNNQSQYPILNQLADQIRVEIPLTSSALQTAQLFNQGYSIEEISKFRQLKVSTIEDHIVELAMNDRSFSLNSFIDEQSVAQVWAAVEDYNTRKLKVLHEVVPNLSYFQIRLVLARGDKKHAT